MSRDGHWWGSCGCWWLQLESIVSFWDGFLTWPMVAFGSTHCSAFQRSSDQAELFCALAIRDLTRICHGQQHRACWFPLSICQKPSTLTNLLWRMDQSFESHLRSAADSALKKAVRWRFQSNPPFEKMVKKVGCCKLLAHWVPAWWAPCPRANGLLHTEASVILRYDAPFEAGLRGHKVWHYFRMPWQNTQHSEIFGSFRLAHLQPPQSPVVKLAPLATHGP